MSSAAQKKKTDAAKQQPAAENAPVADDGTNPVEKEFSKKIRNAKKKIGQIDELVLKQRNKEIVLNDEQKDKIAGQKALEKEVKDLEKGLKDYLALQVSNQKKAMQAMRQKESELKKDREGILVLISNALVMYNLYERGVEFDDKLSYGVKFLFSVAFNNLLSVGDCTKNSERAEFNKYFGLYIAGSSDKLPGHESLTYSELADGVSNLLSSGSLPSNGIPLKTEEDHCTMLGRSPNLNVMFNDAVVEATPVVEAPKAKKETKLPKPVHEDYIFKADGRKLVADENKEEEVAGGGADMDFLGGFDAFDDSEDEAQPLSKLEEKKGEAEVAPAEDDGDKRGGRGRGGRGARGRWEDNEKRGGEFRGRGEGRGRGEWRGRGERGRGGRGRGGNGNVDNEGFEMVTNDDNKRGRGRGGRGRGDRGRGDRPWTARGNDGEGRGRGRGGDGEFRGGRGGERGTRGDRGGRPQTVKSDSLKAQGDEKKE